MDDLPQGWYGACLLIAYMGFVQSAMGAVGHICPTVPSHPWFRCCIVCKSAESSKSARINT